MTTNQNGRRRDTQRSKVYAAEGRIRDMRCAKAQALLVDKARLIQQAGDGPVGIDGKAYAPSIDDCQRYVDDLMRSPWVQRRWGQRTITVHWKASGSATGSFFGSRIALPPWSRCEAVILHEVAHNLVGLDDCADHGPEFAGLLLALVRHRMGKEAGDRLALAYRAERVRKSMTAVPPPKHAVVDAAARRDREKARQDDLAHSTGKRRQAGRTVQALVSLERPSLLGRPGSKARAHALEVCRALDVPRRGTDWPPLTHGRIVEAAEVIRAGVKAGLFGSASTVLRARALAVCRALDTAAPLYLEARRTYAATPARW